MTIGEKIAIPERLKVHKEMSVFEHLISKLNEIRVNKTWSYVETGYNFALLLDPEKAIEDLESQIVKEGETEKTKDRKKSLLRSLGLGGMGTNMQKYQHQVDYYAEYDQEDD